MVDTAITNLPALPVPKVFAAIEGVTSELSRSGIAKDRVNAAQGFKFRGIDDILNHVSTLLPKYHLTILPTILSREVTEHPTRDKQGTLFHVALLARFTFWCSDDGSSTPIELFSEAMDSSDKATNKALSAAYKYACILSFAIPVLGSDSDASTPLAGAAPTAPKGFDDWFTDIVSASDDGVDHLKKAWEGSKQEYRDHVEASPALTAAWKDAKKKSAKADKARKGS